MDQARQQWLNTIERFRDARTGPDDSGFWSKRLETASREQVRKWQNEKLITAVAFAYECIPFYRRKFDRVGLLPGDIRSVDDIGKIPFTTKQEMSDDLKINPPWGTYTSVDDRIWRERGWQTFMTSGTTAQPRAFRYTQFDRDLWAWTNARAMWAMGFRPGRDVALLAFGYGPHVWLWGVHYALNLMGIPILTAGGLDSSMRARLVDQMKPTILACTPSYALYLAELMTEMGIDPAASSVRYLFCAGEPGFSVPSTRRRLQEAWGAVLHEFYGCTEAAPTAGAYTCAFVAENERAEVATHFLDDLHLWEVVDPTTGERLPDGEPGVSVVTNLMSEASPQLRFMVGDYTRISRVPCGCGRTHSRALGGFRGRADDMLNVRGVTLFPSSIEDAVRGVPGLGDEFLIEVTRERELDVLTVTVESGLEDRKVVVDTVEREVRSRCELRANVVVVAPGTLERPQLKARRVRDLRAQLD